MRYLLIAVCSLAMFVPVSGFDLAYIVNDDTAWNRIGPTYEFGSGEYDGRDVSLDIEYIARGSAFSPSWDCIADTMWFDITSDQYNYYKCAIYNYETEKLVGQTASTAWSARNGYTALGITGDDVRLYADSTYWLFVIADAAVSVSTELWQTTSTSDKLTTNFSYSHDDPWPDSLPTHTVYNNIQYRIKLQVQTAWDTVLVNFFTDDMGYNVTILSDEVLDTFSTWTADFDGIFLTDFITKSNAAYIADTALPIMQMVPRWQTDYLGFSTRTPAEGYTDIVTSYEGNLYIKDSIPWLHNQMSDEIAKYGYPTSGIGQLEDGVLVPYDILPWLTKDTAMAGFVYEGGTMRDGPAPARRSFTSMFRNKFSYTYGWCHTWELFSNLAAYTFGDTLNPYITDYACFATENECENCWAEYAGSPLVSQAQETYWKFRMGWDQINGIGWHKIKGLDKKLLDGYTADSLVITLFNVSVAVDPPPTGDIVSGYDFRESVYESKITGWHCPAIWSNGQGNPLNYDPDSTWVNRTYAIPTSVPWNAVGLEEGTDYVSTPEDTAHITYDSYTPGYWIGEGDDSTWVVGDSVQFTIGAGALGRAIANDGNLYLVFKTDAHDTDDSADAEVHSRWVTDQQWADVVRYEMYSSESAEAPGGFNQDFYDSCNGVLSVPGEYTLSEDISAAKWGIILANDNIHLDLNGYTLTYADVDSIAVTNRSFETPDTDTNYADGWDFTNADGSYRRAGHHERTSSEDPSLWSGDYALRVETPTTSDTQLIISDDTYTFAADHHWAVSAVYYNDVDGNIDMQIGLMDAVVDTFVYIAECLYGTTVRDGIAIWADFVAPDTSVGYRIGLRAVGCSTANSGYFYVDDVNIHPYRYYGVVGPCDTDLYTGLYMSGDVTQYYCSPDVYPGDWNNVGYNCWVGNGTLAEGSNGVFQGAGVEFLYPASNDTVYAINNTVKGVSEFNLWFKDFTNNVVRNCSLWNHTYAMGKRDDSPSMNIKASNSDGQYGGIIDSNACFGSMHIVIQSKCKVDNIDNGVVDYALPKIYNNFISHNANTPGNGFGIMIWGGGGADIRYNTIRSDTGQSCGRGIQLSALDTTGYDQQSYLRGNYVATQCISNGQQYGIMQNISLQLEGTRGLIADSNTFIGYGRYEAQDVTPSPRYLGSTTVRMSSGDEGYNSELYFAHNTVKALALEDDPVVALYITDLDSRSNIDSNTFVTNDAFLQTQEFNDGVAMVGNEFQIDTTFVDSAYLHRHSGSTIFFYANDGAGDGYRYTDTLLAEEWVDAQTLRCSNVSGSMNNGFYTENNGYLMLVAHPVASSTDTTNDLLYARNDTLFFDGAPSGIRGGSWSGDIGDEIYIRNLRDWTLNLNLVDCEFPNNTVESWLYNDYFHKSSYYYFYDVATPYASWKYGHTITVNTKIGASNQEGATIYFISTDNDTLLSGTSDANGLAIFSVPEFSDSASSSTYNIETDRTFHNDYTIVAQYNSYLADTVVTIDQAKTYVLTMGEVPVVSDFSINNDDATTYNQSVTLNNTCTGSPTHYMASESSDFSGASWQTYSIAPAFSLSTGYEVKTVYFKTKNATGESESVSDAINYAETGDPPVISSFVIDSDADTTYDMTVELDVTATNSPDSIMASESATFDGAVWDVFSATYDFDLSAGDGTKTVYVKVMNEAGTSGSESDDIYYDEPDVPVISSFTINNDDDTVKQRSVSLTFVATNEPTHYMVSEESDFSGASWNLITADSTFTLSLGYGVKTVYFKAKNDAGESDSDNDNIIYWIPVVNAADRKHLLIER